MSLLRTFSTPSSLDLITSPGRSVHLISKYLNLEPPEPHTAHIALAAAGIYW